MSVFAIDVPNRGDLVFCPLQKIFVKRSEPKKIEPRVALSDLCAVDKVKADFLERLVVSVNSKRVDGKLNLGELFFSFSATGDRAFSNLPSVPEAPGFPLAVVEKVQGVSGIERNGHIAVNTQVFSLQQLSRPPTRRPLTRFHFPPISDLASPAYAINSRGPPSSL